MKTIAVLIFPDFQLLDAAGPIGALEMPMRGMDPPPYRLRLIAREAGLVVSSSGVAMQAEAFGDADGLGSGAGARIIEHPDAGLGGLGGAGPSDRLRVRWAGYVRPTAASLYTFKVVTSACAGLPAAVASLQHAGPRLTRPARPARPPRPPRPPPTPAPFPPARPTWGTTWCARKNGRRAG